MAAAAGPGAGFAFRPLRKPEEYRHAEQLQREALGAEWPLAVPAGVLKGLHENGGLVLGAFAEIYLAGVTASAIGWDGSVLYHHSLVTVVRPEYQKHRLGVRLKAFQRDEVLRLGLSEVRWTIDPVHRAAASLGIRHLGARVEDYVANYFGQVETPGGPREDSDRLAVRWILSDPEVERRLAGGEPTPAEVAARHAGSTPIVRTETAETGLRVPTAVEEPSGPSAFLEIPFDLGSVRTLEPGSVRRWRHAVRDGFRAALDLGYRIDDVASVTLEHERRAFYFLSRSGSAPAQSAPSR